MHETHHDTTGDGDTVFTTLPFENVAPIRDASTRGAFTVTIGNVDLPAFISDGCVYLQAPLPLVFEAFAEDISAFIRDLEIRVSDARGATLSLDGDGSPVYGATVAISRVVRNRRGR